MSGPIFREKSIERISSPEKIDDYMKVTSVSMWLVLAAILLMLFAAVIWGFTGRIEDRIVGEDGKIQTVEIAPAKLLMEE